MMRLYSGLIPAAAVLFFIFILWVIGVSDIGGPNVLIDSVRAIPNGDKIGHAGLYAVLAILVSLSLPNKSQKHFGLPLGCVVVLMFALMEEFSQYFFPRTRTLDIYDALADCVGVYGAAWILMKKIGLQ
jgi:VanZ family protein